MARVHNAAASDNTRYNFAPLFLSTRECEAGGMKFFYNTEDELNCTIRIARKFKRHPTTREILQTQNEWRDFHADWRRLFRHIVAPYLANLNYEIINHRKTRSLSNRSRENWYILLASLSARNPCNSRFESRFDNGKNRKVFLFTNVNRTPVEYKY